MDKFPRRWVEEDRSQGSWKKTYFEVHRTIILLHNVNMNFVKRKVVCKMTATFWRPASREWATMGCSAMSWLLANRPQWSRRAPQDDLGDLSCGKPSFLTTVVRSEWFGQEPSVNPWRGINSNSISANIQPRQTLLIMRGALIYDQRKMLRCCKTGSKVTHRVNHLGDQNKYS